MALLAVRGARSRERRRLEPPLFRPLAWLDAEPSTFISIRLPLEESGHLARSTRCPMPSRQGEAFNGSLQVSMHTRRSSRFGGPQTAGRLREWIRGSIGPTGKIVHVWISFAPTSKFSLEVPIQNIWSEPIQVARFDACCTYTSCSPSSLGYFQAKQKAFE
jgi:hypothetical protein